MSFFEIECNDIDQFWEYLDPRNPLKQGYNTSRKLIYRGQANSTWDLQPAALRSNSNPSFLINNDESPTTETQVTNEWKVLSMFIEQCDNSGIKLPGDSKKLRDSLFSKERFEGLFDEKLHEWPSGNGKQLSPQDGKYVSPLNIKN